MSNITKKVLLEISEKEIAPRPRWHFVVRNISMWVLGVIAIGSGSLATAVIIFAVANGSWEIYAYVGESFMRTLLLSMPYIWLLSLVLLLGIAEYAIRKTRRGYRFSLLTLFLGSVSVSVVFGSVLYTGGVGYTIDRVFAKHLTGYRPVIEVREARFVRPEHGLLAGEITRVRSTTDFEVTDFSGTLWQVMNLEPSRRDSFIIATSTAVKMIGITKERQVFLPCHIARFEVRGTPRRLRDGKKGSLPQAANPRLGRFAGDPCAGKTFATSTPMRGL